MSSVLVLIATPDPEEPPTSGDRLRELHERFECRRTVYELGWREILDFIGIFIAKPEEGVSGA